MRAAGNARPRRSRDEARCFGLSREQRATLLAEAGRATANAVRWREMARMLGASMALAS